jgi:DNA-binding transcriptional LysR family regulator
MEFARKHPRVEVELLLLDRIVDLVEEGIDAAIRISHLPESSLVAVPVAETRRVLCASPDYLKSAGTPATPGDLAAHRCVQFSGLSSGNTWSFGGKAPAHVPIRPALRTNQFDVALDAVLQGLGCGQFLLYQVDALLAKRRLRRILGAFEPPAVPIQIVYPHSRLLSPNVRTFVDIAVARLRSRGGHATGP